MPERPGSTELNFKTDDGVELSGEDSDPARPGTPIVLLHGLTATRRYVVMGSRTLAARGVSGDRLRRARARTLDRSMRSECLWL